MEGPSVSHLLALAAVLTAGCGGDGSAGDADTSTAPPAPTTAAPQGAPPPASAPPTPEDPATVAPPSSAAPTGQDGAAGAPASEPGDGGDAPLAPQDGDGAEPPTIEGPTTGPFPPVGDFTQTGPYASTTLVNVGPANNYTIYMPEEPAPDGARNPLVAWTSGGGTTHVLYTLLPHLASHGFVVITANTIPGIGAEAQLGQEILAGIDFVLEENGRAGSELFERVDATKIASTGYSMGSLATFQIADDPRLTTTVHISGGNMMPGGTTALHAPAAFICGVPDPACTNLLSATCDIAGANCATDFEEATTPVFYATFESGHLGILTSPFMERINAMTTAWLRHYLMDDTSIAGMFMGDACEYCSQPDWTVQRKQLD